MDTCVLENDTLRLTFDRANGALVDLTAIETNWSLLDRPHLGLSFRLLVPLRRSTDDWLTGKRNNPVLGEKQALTSLDVAADGHSATFVWDGVTSEEGGPLDIRVILTVDMAPVAAVHAATFAMTLENRSPYTVEAVFCPYLGDIAHPEGADWFKTFIYQYATAGEASLWPTYTNMRGYYGVDYPIQLAAGAPMSPYILLRSADQGLYAGVAAPSSELVAWHTELHPGYGSSIDARVPETRTIAGQDVATRFAAVHMPFIQPGETRALTPVMLAPFRGGWQQGVEVYKAWRNTWMRTPALPAWAREPHAWQQIHINSPEDELRIRFTDLVKVGEECARHGVKAIQLTGWNFGGQDQGNPSHDPDPRLGAFEELREAIAAIQALGVKVILFTKFTWADRATERFRKELIKVAVKDPYGDYQVHPGYQYHTMTQLLDLNSKRFVPMCFLSEDYLRLCEEEFRKTLDLGADGILFDECLHHSPTLLCFDESHGHRYGAPTYANDRLLIQRFAEMAWKRNPDFLFAAEAAYDWEFEAYQASYHRSESKHHIPLSRVMLPHALLVTAVTGFNDRNMVNQCLLYRYAISYEPYNFKGHLDDYPETMAYGKQMDALRTELRDIFWDGEFHHEVGATVTVEGARHHPYAVYAGGSDGKPGVVVANYDDHKTITVAVTMDDGTRLTRYRLVDDPRWTSTDEGIVLPPRSAAVIV